MTHPDINITEAAKALSRLALPGRMKRYYRQVDDLWPDLALDDPTQREKLAYELFKTDQRRTGRKGGRPFKNGNAI